MSGSAGGREPTTMLHYPYCLFLRRRGFHFRILHRNFPDGSHCFYKRAIRSAQFHLIGLSACQLTRVGGDGGTVDSRRTSAWNLSLRDAFSPSPIRGLQSEYVIRNRMAIYRCFIISKHRLCLHYVHNVARFCGNDNLSSSSSGKCGLR